MLATGFAAINCCFSAAAEEPPQPAFPYAGAIIARGIASRFIDGRTFILDDGREVRLAAIEVPPLPLPQEPGTAPGGAAARDALAGLLAGSEVVAAAGRAAKSRPLRTRRGVCLYRTRRRRTLGAGGFDRGWACPRRGAGGKPGVRSGTPEPGKHRAAPPSLAFGPVRIMTRSTPITPPMCWPSKAILRWSRVRWFRCARAGRPST